METSVVLEKSAPDSPAVIKPPKEHIDFLDGIRGIAALYVVIFHASAMVYNPDVHPTGLGWTLSRWVLFGHVSVVVFIVLSGYCLMLPVVRGDGNLRGGVLSFFKRRARRILIPYYFCLALSLLAIWLFIGQQTGTAWDRSLPISPFGIGTHLLMIHNLFAFGEHLPQSTYSQINYPLWTVAVEWQIYFTFPLFVLCWRKYGPYLSTAGFIMAAYILTPLVRPHFFKGLTPHFLGLFCLGALAAGISYGKDSRIPESLRRLPWNLIAFAAAFVAVMLYQIQFKQGTIIDFVVSISTISALIAFSQNTKHPGRRFFAWKPIAFLGSFSYSLYLTHGPALQLLWQALGFHHSVTPDPVMRYLIIQFAGIPFCLVFAWVFFRFCELPYMSNPAKKAAPTVESGGA